MTSITVVLFVTFLAACSAAPLEQDFSITDEQGGYHFGYNSGQQARQEKRTPEGVVLGAYRYIDANGETQTVTYTADEHNGFLASGSNIPKVPSEVENTPEVKAAKAEQSDGNKKASSGGEVSGVAPIKPLNQLPLAGQLIPALGFLSQAQQIYALLQNLIPRGNKYPSYEYVNQAVPVVQYIVPTAQYHADYQPYAAL